MRGGHARMRGKSLTRGGHIQEVGHLGEVEVVTNERWLMMRGGYLERFIY